MSGNYLYVSERWKLVNGKWVNDFSEMDESEYFAFSTIVGQVVLLWAAVDQQIDHWSDVIFKYHGGNALSKWDRLPKGARRRADFLKDCFSEIAKLAPLQKEALEILLELGATAKTRDDLIHGALVDMKPAGDSFDFHKLDHSPMGFSYRKVSVNAKLMGNLIENIVRLNTRALSVSDELRKLAQIRR